MGFFDKLRDGLTRTTQQIVGRFDEIVQRVDTPAARERAIDVDTIEALEEVLLSWFDDDHVIDAAPAQPARDREPGVAPSDDHYAVVSHGRLAPFQDRCDRNARRPQRARQGAARDGARLAGAVAARAGQRLSGPRSQPRTRCR